MGRRRLSFDSGGLGPLRHRIAATRLPQGKLAPPSFHFAENKFGRGDRLRYGLGIRKSKSGQRIFEHAGGSVGGSCQLILYPDSRVVVAFVTNLGDAPWKIEDIEAIAEPFENKTR